MPEQLDRLVPLHRAAGVRLVMHGHEHNFQHGHVEGLDYVISGAGGKLDQRPPTRVADAGTRSWAAIPHCLLVQVAPDRLTVTPYGPTATGARPIPRRQPDGSTTDEPIIVGLGWPTAWPAARPGPRPPRPPTSWSDQQVGRHSMSAADRRGAASSAPSRSGSGS
jgi:hypothetical protein